MSCGVFQAVAGADKSLHQLIAQQAGQLLLRMTMSIRMMTMLMMMDPSKESSYELLLCDHPVTVPVHLREQLVRKLGQYCVYILLQIPWQDYSGHKDHGY